MALVTTEKYAQFTGSTTPQATVLLNSVVSVEKQNISALPGQPASSAQYAIVFTMREADSREKTQTIKYGQNVTKRDADLATFIAATTLVIP